MRAPGAVGMSAERLVAIDRVVQRGLNAGGYPGASVVVGRKGFAVFKKGYGHLGWTFDSPNVSPDKTIFDLASLSKVIGTTTAAMVLHNDGKLDLDAPVRVYLPEFSGGAKDLVTVRHLLTHRSGLPPGRELWREASSPAEARELVLHTPLGCRPGDCYEYSDLGADVLGSGRRGRGPPATRQVPRGAGVRPPRDERHVLPAGRASLRYRIAPTEVTPPRGYPLRGEVHDENAYALGGVAGHAGLFSTAADLSIFAQMMLNGGTYDGMRIVGDSTVSCSPAAPPALVRSAGNLQKVEFGSGDVMSPRAYGHTGYTGTSIWIDPDRQLFVVLLTNRVHAARAKRPSKVISDVRNDLADAAALSVTDSPAGPLAMPVSFRADRATDWNRPIRHARSKHRSSKSHSAAKSRSHSKKKAPAKKSSGAKGSLAKARKTAGKRGHA